MITSHNFDHVVHEKLLKDDPTSNRRATELFEQHLSTDERQRALLPDEHDNKHVVASVVEKTLIGFWALDVDGEVAAPKVEELADLSEENESLFTLLFLGVCRGRGWVRCLGLKLVGEGVDAMFANVWRRLGTAWILEEAWDAMGGIEGEVTVI